MSLTLDEVRQIRFRMTRRGELGYQVVDVDTFIDRVEATVDEMEKERERLRREVDSAQNTAVSPAVVTDDSALREAVQEKDNEISGLRGEVHEPLGESHVTLMVVADLSDDQHRILVRDAVPTDLEVVGCSRGDGHHPALLVEQRQVRDRPTEECRDVLRGQRRRS